MFIPYNFSNSVFGCEKNARTTELPHQSRITDDRTLFFKSVIVR